ncbi:MAG TPA: flagellar biosynthesis anti-sigma factor FlgM [Burkholderiaceae bacterium]|nr:flagellar biosynthesis anti-sigma factor FlgM [Burkholderiaceae bacterium]
MRHEHPTHQDAAIERRALAEWESLLVRLRAAADDDVRLERVRHAIARGEFQVDARAVAGRLIARFLVS